MKKTVTVLFLVISIISALGACYAAKPADINTPEISAAPQTPQPTPQPTPTPTPEPTPQPTPADSPEEISIKRDLLVWKMAYPDYISGFEMDEDGFIYAVMQSGNKILYDDKKQKTFEEKMNGADLQDALEMIYPLEDLTELLDGDFDPGRVRPYALFNEVYGNSEKAVKANLVGINVKNSPFNKNNGASEAITNVFDKLKELCALDGGLKKFIYPTNGTFCFRKIADTNNPSMHSYAIAIDLNAHDNPSWKSISREKGWERISVFPAEIVSAFEDNGFIWGGKWAHFDIMHFEYRPEIIIKARYNAEISEQPWYTGFPDDEQVKSYIEMIDEVFR